MDILEFDKECNKYYVLVNENKKYLSPGDILKVYDGKAQKTGRVEHSKYVKQNYYLFLDNGDYIVLSSVSEIEY